MLIRMTMAEASEVWSMVDSMSLGPQDPNWELSFKLSKQLDKLFGNRWIVDMPDESESGAFSKVVDSIRAQTKGLVPNTDAHYSFDLTDADVKCLLEF